MTVGRGFGLHPLAAQDIAEIWEYIADDSPLAARRVRETILEAIHALVPFPNQGHRRTDLTSRPLRFIVVYEYLIAYAPEEKPLWVIAVMHGRRNPRVLAAILRGRE
jgi:antitoxin ParD1/3/4